MPSLAPEEECLIQETGEEEYVNNLKEKVFELENSIVKLNIDHEQCIGEKEKQLDDLNKSIVTVRKENGTVKKKMRN